MRRAWGLSAAVAAASTYLCLYLMTLLPLPIWNSAPTARFDRTDPAFAYQHLLVYFVDLSARDAYFQQTRGWVWLPRLVLAVALVTAVYLATRAVAAGRARIAVAQAGAVLLAAGLADLVALAVVVARADEAGRASPTFAAALAESGVFWTYDALFFGFLCSFVVISCFFLQRLLWALLGRPLDALADPPVRDDGPTRTGNLALACSLPVVALALLGGAFTYSGKPENEIRLVDELAGIALHPRLQLRPQADPEAGFDEVVGAEQWLPGSVSAVLFIVVVWLLLRWVLAGLRPTAGPVAALVAIWGAVVAASAFGGIVDALVATHTSPLLPNLSYAVPHATRFGALWGWLPAVIALTALRRRQLAE